MSDVPVLLSRPKPISVVCVVGWMLSAFQMTSALLPEAKSFAVEHGAPAWLPPFVALCAALSAVAFFGMWRMRRAGVLGYILVTAALNGAMLYAHAWGAQVMLFPAVATLIALGFLSRMR